MPDFLTRLIKRTMGTAEVVQPLGTPMFAREEYALGGLSASAPIEKEPPSSKENIGISDYTIGRQPSSEAALLPRPFVMMENDLSRESAPDSIQTRFANETEEKVPDIRRRGREDADPNTLVADTAYRKVSPSPKREMVTRTGLKGSGDSNGSERREAINQVEPLSFPPLPTPIEARVQSDRILSHRSHFPEAASSRILEKPTDVIDPHGDLKKAGKLDTDSPLLVPMSRNIYFEGGSVSETRQAGPFDAFSSHSGDISSAGPPTIKVTIGRVEVKAITPPVPPERAKPARPSPHLSLEEYLKQQGQRQR